MRRGNLDDLVAQQARRWELRQRADTASPSLSCIALSRFPYSGAAELGQRVAEKLDYGFFGIEIVDRIASDRGVDRALVAELDERVRSTIDRYVLDGFRQQSFSETHYLRAVVRTIVTLAERGMVVILGRGAPFVLGPEKALRVLVVAPIEQRIEKLALREGLAAKDARSLLAREDERRRLFLAQFGVDPDDPSLYDLVVNPDSLGLDTAATLVIDALRAAAGRAA